MEYNKNTLKEANQKEKSDKNNIPSISKTNINGSSKSNLKNKKEQNAIDKKALKLFGSSKILSKRYNSSGRTKKKKSNSKTAKR